MSSRTSLATFIEGTVLLSVKALSAFSYEPSIVASTTSFSEFSCCIMRPCWNSGMLSRLMTSGPFLPM